MKRRLMIVAVVLLGSLLAGLSVQAIEEVTPTPEPETEATAAPTTPAATPTAAPADDINIDALLQEAVQDLQSGASDAAIEKTTRIIQADPANDTAYFYRGVAYAQQRNYSEAESNFTEAINLESWNWEYYTFRADIYAQMNEYGNALLDYDEAIFRNPRFQPAFQGRAEANYQLGDNTAGDIDDSIARGIGRLQQGSADAAVDFFSDAINQADGSRPGADAYYNRALTYAIDGDNENAIPDYTSALDIFDNHHDAYLGRGISYRQTDRTQAAGEDFLNRMEILERDSFNETMSIGDQIDIEMAYGNVYRIEFEAAAGDVLNITARDAEGVNVDPLIALVDPQGNVIGGDDDFGGGLDSQLDEFEMPASGTYTLVVSHANGGFDGLVAVRIDPTGSQT